MTGWTTDEAARLDSEEELQLSSLRLDGTLRPWARIWFVRHGADVYVRSAYGPDNGWYRRALASTKGGRIRVAGLERDVTFETPDHALDAALSAAYETKYGRYAKGIVRTVVSADAARSTLRVVPLK
jgi:hypothetical protein